MKKITLSVLSIVLVTVLAAGATFSAFVDEEVSEDNTFATGNLDLTVDGENGPFSLLFETENMVPGTTYSAGCVELTNAGSTDGVLTVEASNLVSNENGLVEPEETDGDTEGTEVDPSGFDQNDGDGELWDQLAIRFFIDDGAGSHTGNELWDWDDTGIYSNFGTPSSDYSSYYSLPLESDLVGGDVTLAAGNSVSFCTEVHFVDDTSNWWWGAQNGLTNNMAMTDDAMMDITFGLTQAN